MTTPKLFSYLPLIVLLVPLLSNSQEKIVNIRIAQDQSFLLNAYENSVILKKKTFKIQVLLENTAGIYVFAAFTDSICCQFSELDTIVDFMSLPDRSMAEPEYNRDKELLVNDDNSCSYWYYDKEKSWQGFNKKVFFLDTSRLVAIKTVKQLFHVPTQREIKLKDINGPLYLFFVAVKEFDSAGKPLKELMRKKVKIDWINED